MFVLEWVYQVFLVYIHKFSLLVCELLTVTVIFSKKKILSFSWWKIL